MSVVAKFQVMNINDSVVEMEAVTRDSENKDWSQWTPWGSIKMGITNEAALEQFEVGGEYEITFTRSA